ncbi:DUF6624 domain-containing protein [Tenacibaculum maritimum]|uniref:DUF6624 domain-containing protein n=1 Tax=Tenacibaculum maritimum TaxID=107401 RepID=UPI003876C8A2
MNLTKIYILLLMYFIGVLACKKTNSTKNISNLQFNKELSNQLIKMAELDQLAAAPFKQEKFKTLERYKTFKDSVFRINKIKIEKIFNQYNYPGINLVGVDGERSFWLMTQHCDFDYSFQKKILTSLKIEVERGNAKPSHLALLTDRININQEKKQIYGTQVSYNKYGQAFPKPLKDSFNVDNRRKAVGLISLKEYLNNMTISHFNMNKKNYIKKGVLKPKIYK